MSDRDRGDRNPYLGGDFLAGALLLVYVLVAVIAFWSGHENERRTYEPHQHGVSAADRAKDVCVNLPRSAVAKCVIKEIAAAEDTSRDEQDLQAQQQMSLWALLMFLTSFLALGATVWALIYVKATLDETRKMAGDTNRMAGEADKATGAALKAAEAGREANEIARESSEKQLRAYLTVETVEANQFDDEGGVPQWVFFVQWKNTGQTPAINVTGALTVAHFSPKIPDDFPFLKYEPADSTNKMNLGPGQIMLADNSPPNVNQVVEDAARRKCTLYIWGFVEYDTISKGPRRRTEMCVEFQVTRANGKVSFSPKPFGPYNGMDERAMRQPAD